MPERVAPAPADDDALLAAMSAITFGDRSAALAAARAIERAHAAVAGTLPHDVGRYRAGSCYSALDPEAAAEEYYADHCAIARLLGIPRTRLPASWRAFGRYFEGMLSGGDLAADDTAREIAQSVLSTAAGRDAEIARIFTTALLPPVLRDAYGLRWRPEHEARFAALVRSVGGLRRAEPVAPSVDADPESR
ncbi:MAG: oxygenase MpaB family protein [Myxococcota bacterium]